MKRLVLAALGSFAALAVLHGEIHANGVDRFVFARLKTLGIAPADVSSDAVFVRRVYLDAIGTLPTQGEVRAFLDDRSPGRRAALIDRLLERDEFADYWAMKWSETLRVKSEFPINLWPNAVQAYHRWIRTSIRDNVPYDRFARELLTASGSNFRTPQVNFYRAVQSREPKAIAAAVALTFMGTRIESWPQDRASAMAAFFSRIGYKTTREWKEEIVFPLSGPAALLRFPDGTTARLGEHGDPRELFAAWLTAPTNRSFSTAIVNRVWFWLLGRGIVHEPDDIRPDNAAVNPELLDFLASDFVRSGYDLKRVYRLILNSRTYQLSAIPKSDRPEADAHFAYYAARPLDAEVLVDALCQITGTSEPYVSAIPEPYTFMPLDQRAVALPDGSITSAVLETFGRPTRDSGLLSERSARPTAAARLHLLNSSHIQQQLEQGPAIRTLMQGRGGMRTVATNVYLTILSRYPTEEELKIAEAYARTPGMNPRNAALDLAWALINSVEFLYRH